MDIIAAYREVGTYRGAAAVCATTPKTVRRVIERHESGGAAPARARRGHNYDEVSALVAARVDSSRGKISAKRLLPVVRAAGYAGSGRNLRRLVAAQKVLWRKENPSGRRPAVWSPAQHLVIDWGVLGGLHVFCAVLAWSRFRFVRFADNERADTTLGLLAECFEALGGVPHVVLADRMGCLKGAVVADRVVPTETYVAFAAHYGFRPDFCQGADPRSKGIVENLVGYAKTDLMIPGPGGDGASGFTDPGQANTHAVAWCAEVNSALHAETCKVPLEQLSTERELLGILPSLRPSVGRSVARKVDRLSCVRFASARYSVPERFIGERVRVRVEDDRAVLIIAGRGEGEVVAEHPLQAPGGVSVLDAHYGRPRPDTPARAVRPRTEAEKAFCALGPVAEAFLAGSAASGNTRLAAELAEINTLVAAHGTEAVVDALSRAVAFGRWRAADIRSILAAGAGTPTPTEAGQLLHMPLPAVPVRPLSAYAIRETMSGEDSGPPAAISAAVGGAR